MIRKVAGGRYEVGVDLGKDATGKRLRVFRRARTRQEAASLQARLIAQRDTGIAVSPGTITVSQFLDRWLHDHAEPNLKEKTVQRYAEIIRLHLIPVIGAVALSKLRPMHIQGVLGKAREAGLSARTCLHIHRLLRTALAQAVRWQLLSLNPADACDAPKVLAAEIVLPDLDAIQRLLVAADATRHGPMIALTLESGLRYGEVTALVWDDVDWDTATLRVARSATWVVGKCEITSPKTARSRRVVGLSQSTVQSLRLHRIRQQEHRLRLGPVFEDHGLVFPAVTGNHLNPASFWRQWRQIRATAGVELRFHDLRHYSATLALHSGVGVRVVAERLGHADATTTLRTYAHVMAGADTEAAESIAAALRRTG